MSAQELNNTVLKNSSALKAYYRFESGALTTDSSGNSNTLTAISDPAEGTGVFGGGVDLDGNDGYSITDHASLKPTGNFSVGAWVKTSTTGAFQVISQSWRYASAVRSGYLFFINNSNVVGLMMGKNSGNTLGVDYSLANSATTVTDGKWHHIVGTFNGSTISIYIDAKHEYSTAWANNAVYNATTYCAVGSGNDSGTPTNFFTGSLDDVFLLNGTALSADQIKELYEGRFIGESWPQAGLVGGWHLNGGSTDFSGNNNHGTDTAITYSQANGKFGQGAGFNGSTSRCIIEDSASLDCTQWSVSAWFNTNDVGTRNIVAKMRSGSPDTNYVVDLNGAGGKLRTYCNNASATQYTLAGNTTIATNTWYHVVVTYNTSALTIYLNGNIDGTTAVTGNCAVNSHKLYIGCRTDVALNLEQFFNGKIDEVLIFNRALTPQEIRKMYGVGTGRYY